MWRKMGNPYSWSVAGFRLERRGSVVQSWRSISSSKKGKSALSEKSEEPREKRTAAIESVAKKYMVAKEGVFPTVKQVHNEVGGAKYILRGILSDLKGNYLPGNENHDQATKNEHLKDGNIERPPGKFPVETMSEDVQGPLIVENKPTEGLDQSSSGNSSNNVTHSGLGCVNSVGHTSVEHNSSHVSSLKDRRTFPESGDHELSWLANVLVKKAVPRAEGLFSKNSGFRRPLDANQEGGKRMALLQQIKDYAEQVKNEKRRHESVCPTGKSEPHDVEFHKDLQKTDKLEENQENADWCKCGSAHRTETNEASSAELEMSDDDDDDDGKSGTTEERHRKPEGISVFYSILAMKDGFAHPFPSQKLDNSQTGECESGDDSDYAAADYVSDPEENMQKKIMAQKSDVLDNRKHQNSNFFTKNSYQTRHNNCVSNVRDDLRNSVRSTKQAKRVQ